LAKYNAFRSANRALDNARRLERSAEKRARAEAALIAHAEALMAGPQPKPGKYRPALRLRLTVEIVGHGKHRFTADYCPVFARWSVSQRQILAGISALMQRAPVIAGIAPDRIGSGLTKTALVPQPSTGGKS
jgi:hypothetical protein